MEALIDFLLNNYVWFLIVCLVMLFALIGYFVDSNNPKVSKKKVIKPIQNTEDNTFKVHPSVEAYTNEDFDEPLMK